MSRGLKRTRPILLALGLFLVNAWICRELFSADFLGNTDTNEGAFVSLARFFRDFGFFERWFPWFNCGMPIENAYQPFLPMAVALVGKLTGWSLEHAFHFFLAVVYCAGPVTLFWLAWDWSESLTAAFAAGAFYSIWSPAMWLIPVLRVDAPLRFYNLVHYAEDPHNVALTLLPLALLFLRRRRLVPAVLFCSAVVLSNAFGAMDLAIGGLCIAIASRGGWRKLLLTGVVAYCLISPWLPPSLIALMRRDQWSARGLFHSRPLLLAASLAVVVLVGWLTRRLPPFMRFSILFGLVMCAIPMAFFHGDITFVPQANRYQLELEMAICILLGSLVASCDRRFRLSAFSKYRQAIAPVALCAVLLAGAVPARRAAHRLTQPIDITQTTQYRTNSWLNSTLHGERAMVAGDTEFLYNVISNNPQMSGGHEPTVPNWSERVGIYAFYVGAPNPEDAILWLKAFGARALTWPAGQPRFEGHLPLLWSDHATDIFGIPHRGDPLAHVIPSTALVKQQPIHSLDVNPLRAYVAALEDPSLPVATMQGDRIHARLRKDQLISVQVNYAPGWTARVNGAAVPVSSDAIGLIAIQPACEGDCDILLRYGVSTEAWACRILSLLAALFLPGWLLFADRQQTGRVPQRPYPDPEFAE